MDGHGAQHEDSDICECKTKVVESRYVAERMLKQVL